MASESDLFIVYAMFDLDVLIIDTVKRDALQAELIRELTTTTGEKLEHKLARVVLDDQGEDMKPSDECELRVEFYYADTNYLPITKYHHPVLLKPGGGMDQVRPTRYAG